MENCGEYFKEPVSSKFIPDRYDLPDGAVGTETDDSNVNGAIFSGCEALRSLNIGKEIGQLPIESLQLILKLAGPRCEEVMRRAVPPFHKFDRVWEQLDLSNRDVNKMLVESAVKAVHVDFSFAMFQPGVCNFSRQEQDYMKAGSSVKSLDLTGVSIGTSTLNLLLNMCPLLESLSLEAVQMSLETLASLSELKFLKVLNMSGCTGLTDVDVVRAIIRVFPNVTNISLSGTDISAEGLTIICQGLNPKLEIASFADLGIQFEVSHLAALATRCPEIRSLDVSTTRAAEMLDAAHYMDFRHLEDLAANMAPGKISLINTETLMSFKILPSLKVLFIHRRILATELQRFAGEWKLNFAVVRGLYTNPGSAAVVSRSHLEKSDTFEAIHQNPHRREDPL